MVEVTSRFRTRDRFVVDAAGGWQPERPAQELALYLKPTDLMPTDGIVKETAIKITERRKVPTSKGRAL